MEEVTPSDSVPGNDEWDKYEDQDAFFDEYQSKEIQVSTPAELEHCKAECLALGYGGFVVRRNSAWLRPYPREELLERKSWRSKATLYLSPEPASASAEGRGGAVTVEYSSENGVKVQVSDPDVLAANSGYFASAFRHTWSDGGSGGSHRLCALPGGDRAWDLVAPWLATAEGSPIGSPWPVKECEDVEHVLVAAAYLDAPRLLRAAVKSWRLSWPRPKDEVFRVAEAIVEASSQFSGEASDGVMDELKSLLQELPKHQLVLSQEFLAMPAAGLAILDIRESAKETVLGHVRNAMSFFKWPGERKVSGDEDDGKALSSPHDFAITLFEAHDLFFLDHLAALRRLLRYVEPQKYDIPVPVCFKIASAAAHAARSGEADGDDGSVANNLAADILERGLSSSLDPAQAASHEDCVVGLFGAACHRGTASSGFDDVGEVRRAGPQVRLDLDVLARKNVPPAAAAVILSRVLSSWGAVHENGTSKGKELDPAAVILRGVADDRQGVRRLLVAVLPLIAQENSMDRGTEWGSSFDYAVPELQSAFMHAASSALAAGSSISDDATLRLLFRIVYQPSGGLHGIAFPLLLLQELRPHSTSCQAMVAMRVLHEWQAAASKDLSRGFALAEELWHIVQWDSVEMDLILRTIRLFRDWLGEAKSKMPSDERARAKATTVQLLLSLPLQDITNPEEMFGPPIPSHFMATLAYRESIRAHQSIAMLKAENATLRYEIARLRDSSRS